MAQLSCSHAETILELLATNWLGERIDASAAIVGNQLFLRGWKACYGISDDSKAK